MIGENVASANKLAQYEGLCEAQDTQQAHSGTQQPYTIANSRRTNIILCIVAIVLVIYLCASLYAAATELTAEGFAVVSAINALVTMCVVICMCIYSASRKDKRFVYATQDLVPPSTQEELSQGMARSRVPEVAENAPHQDLHGDSTESPPAPEDSMLSGHDPSSSQQQSGLPSSPEALQYPSDGAQPTAGDSASSKESTPPTIVVEDTDRQVPVTKPVTKASISSKESLQASTAPPLAPRRAKSPQRADAGLSQQSSPSARKLIAKSITKADISSPISSTLMASGRAKSPQRADAGSSQQPSPSTRKLTAKPITKADIGSKESLQAGTAPPLAPKRAKSPQRTDAGSLLQQKVPITKPATKASISSKESLQAGKVPLLAPRRAKSPQRAYVRSPQPSSSRAKSTLPTIVVEDTDRQVPVTKASISSKGSLQTSTAPPLAPRRAKSPQRADAGSLLQQQVPITKPVTKADIGSKESLQASTAPLLAPRCAKFPRYMGISSLSRRPRLPSLPEEVQYPSDGAQPIAGTIESSIRELERSIALVDKPQSLPKATARIDDSQIEDLLLGIDSLFTVPPSQPSSQQLRLPSLPEEVQYPSDGAQPIAGTIESSIRELERSIAPVDKPKSLSEATAGTIRSEINEPEFRISGIRQSKLSLKVASSAAKREMGDIKTNLRSGARKVRRNLLKKVELTASVLKAVGTGPSHHGRSSAAEKSHAHAGTTDVVDLGTNADTNVITCYENDRLRDTGRNSTLADDLHLTDAETRSPATEGYEGKSAIAHKKAEIEPAITPRPSTAPQVAYPTTTSKTIKGRMVSLGKAVTHAAYLAYVRTEQAFGIHDSIPSKTYSFQLAPEIAEGGPQDVYLLIRGKDNTYYNKSALAEITGGAEVSNLWLCAGALHTKLGHVPISNLECRIMVAGNERSSKYKLRYQIAIKLIMPAFGAVPHLLTDMQSEFFISHSGKSRDLFVTTIVSTSSRTNMIKLIATSATFQSYRKAFFHIYTESIIHAMVKHMNAIMRREFAHPDQQSLTVCAAIDTYADRDPRGMMCAITGFFLQDPLGIAVYSDTALCMKFIGELIRFCISSGDYPAHHALFWKLVVQEVWGRSRCRNTGIPDYDWRAHSYNKEFVTDLHIICALVCKKQAITDIEGVYSLIDKIMQTYSSTSDSVGTRLAHYLALATVASPRLQSGIKALDIPNDRWKKLLRTVEYALKLCKPDAEASAIKALSRESGAKHPCRINALLLNDFTETTAYKIALQGDQTLQQLRNILGPDYAPHKAATAPENVSHIISRHTHTKKGVTLPYAVLISHLQDAYLRVEGKYYSKHIIPTLLCTWENLRAQNPEVANEPMCEDAKEAINLLTTRTRISRCHMSGWVSPGTRLTACAASYPFSGKTLEQIGDAALTGFLHITSVSSAMKELNLLQPECGIHLDVARAVT
ncbi:hypothetical protein ACIS_00703 [Anaplasma centrale str. Israel]|uniref:Uncharacterized protein n=1 Tax=Anaplasma centrale (strain Israel) TaxID=574556 RepID=D1AUP4_ANACI|nr:hypothetical protein [Anaplasma centrale]ACZ49272.1 hypothetical protein ACIS_00703 [Anaplasma centrale str. Israel]